MTTTTIVTTEKAWLTSLEAATLAGVSPVAISKWVKAGLIETQRRGRFYLVNRDSLTKYLSQRQTKTAAKEVRLDLTDESSNNEYANVEWAECSKCGSSWPLTSKFWHKTKGRNGVQTQPEFHTICKVCRRKQSNLRDKKLKGKIVSEPGDLVLQTKPLDPKEARLIFNRLSKKTGTVEIQEIPQTLGRTKYQVRFEVSSPTAKKLAAATTRATANNPVVKELGVKSWWIMKKEVSK